MLRALTAFNEIDEIVESFSAEAVDCGQVWSRYRNRVTPDQRVDKKLLRNLQALDKWLRTQGGLKKDISHALIGKFVYFHYLKDRGFISPRKLERWNLEKCAVFGRDVQIDAVVEMARSLEDSLNGQIFPLDFDSPDAPRQQHLTWVAGIFSGDEVGGGGRQLSLDFNAYNFSYIPIETLSIIYEQFLHTPEENAAITSGKEAGAYYTPLPLVNFILSEMEDNVPLERGIAIFDPSCGSGAFLVQCYRRLIEKEMYREKRDLRPTELRDLLVRHIFGVDRDPDACSLTELSLLLTLLDYVDPPDLENTSFKLPSLRGENIFESDFFDDDAPWERKLAKRGRIWVVGNPPWKKLDPNDLSPADEKAWSWMSKLKDRSIGDNQLAQAFVWRLEKTIPEKGYVGFLLPAMTLFETKCKIYRKDFFETFQVDSVANFSNLAEVLFGGRSRVPAAAFFYRPRIDGGRHDSAESSVAVYAPLVANQEATRPTKDAARNESWSLVVNASEVRRLPLEDVAGGEGLPWKLATWGSHLDVRMLQRLERHFDSFEDLEDAGCLVLAQGPELRNRLVEKGSEKTTYCAEVVGKNTLDMRVLQDHWHIFDFPKTALKENENHFVRHRGGRRGLKVCRPPHVIVNAARRFAVYSNKFLLAPPRQVGIASTSEDQALLKALSLYLSSDFAFYHQFLTSTQFGVKRDVATLDALRAMPVPLAQLPHEELAPWDDLHGRLVEASRVAGRRSFPADEPKAQGSLFEADTMDVLLAELNQMTNRALGLNTREQALVHDLVRVRLALNDGKTGWAAVRPPTDDEMDVYGRLMRHELDAFIGTSVPKKHVLEIVHDDLSGMVCVDLVPGRRRKVRVTSADRPTAAELADTRHRLLRQRSQWLYFNRNLRIYEGTRTYVLKPMQYFHWTKSQAIFDAREIIAETLSAGGAA